MNASEVIVSRTLGGAVNNLAQPTQARDEVAYVAVGSKLYFIGGKDGSSVIQQSMDIYDIASNTWSTGAAPPVGRESVTAVHRAGVIYLVGGKTGTSTYYNTVYAYDIAANSWSLSSVVTPATVADDQAVIIGDNFYLVRGEPGGTTQSANSALYKYSFSTGLWASGLTNLPASRAASASFDYNGKFHVFGGHTGGVANQKCYRYEDGTNTWVALADQPLILSEAIPLVPGNGLIYICGGMNNSNVVSSAILTYNPTNNTWANNLTMPRNRTRAAGMMVGNRAYLAFGTGTTSMDAMDFGCDIGVAASAGTAESVAGGLPVTNVTTGQVGNTVSFSPGDVLKVLTTTPVILGAQTINVQVRVIGLLAA
jgi:N-acetylneuraminic acid mutarotase